MVRPLNQVSFTRYFDGQLWYQVDYWDGDGTPSDSACRYVFEFPGPVSDIGNATFFATDKAILFMRYIRKHLEMIEKARAEQDVPMAQQDSAAVS